MTLRRGATLIEVMLSGGIICLVSLVLFEGIIVARRIAHENAEILSAEAVVWDAVWKKFNEDFDKLRVGTTTETLVEAAAPALYDYDTAPVLTLNVTQPRGYTQLRGIEGDLEWGPSASRRKLSNTLRTFVYRGALGRVINWQ